MLWYFSFSLNHGHIMHFFYLYFRAACHLRQCKYPLLWFAAIFAYDVIKSYLIPHHSLKHYILFACLTVRVYCTMKTYYTVCFGTQTLLLIYWIQLQKRRALCFPMFWCHTANVSAQDRLHSSTSRTALVHYTFSQTGAHSAQKHTYCNNTF